MEFVVDTPYLVPFDGSFRVAEAPTVPPAEAAAVKAKGKKEKKEKKGKKEKKEKKGKRKAKDARKDAYKDALEEVVEELYELQRMLYAQDEFSVLLVFQAMDAAGKDSTIRAVMTGINPAGCQVFSFKQPSDEELDHDFLWRTTTRMPERGRIGIFNRSYYEEVLVVKVHPEYLQGQKLPGLDMKTIWQERYESIADSEKHLARNGTVILKFWLNVSRDEQRDRFLARIDDPTKNWKFSHGDLEERALWPKYMAAYQEALNATSRPWAPWYAIPADDKPFMRLTVAQVLRDTLKKLPLAYPKLGKRAQAGLAAARAELAKQ
jgi:PPK2 family polyphosphate:nucleotide phosphotransferase